MAGSVDRNFELVRADIGDLRAEMRGLRVEMREGFQELRADLSAWQRQIAQIGWALAVALIGAIVALVVAVA